MSLKFIIRKMAVNELQIAIDWAQKEGWNPGLNDAWCFYQADPNGFFIGTLNGEVIATGAAVAYDENYAFCGLYIVKPEFRTKGYGLKLTHERLRYVGDRVTGLDGVLDKVSKYERLGYEAAYRQTRYELSEIQGISASQQPVDLNTVPFEQVEKLDRKFFPAPRKEFLKSWMIQHTGFALGVMEGQTLKGYGVIRKCHQGYKIGPLFAESPSVAKQLFDGLCGKVKEGPVYLDIPEPNKEALLLVKEYKMVPKFEVIRMYRNGIPDIDVHGIYGVTTFELG